MEPLQYNNYGSIFLIKLEYHRLKKGHVGPYSRYFPKGPDNFRPSKTESSEIPKGPRALLKRFETLLGRLLDLWENSMRFQVLPLMTSILNDLMNQNARHGGSIALPDVYHQQQDP